MAAGPVIITDDGGPPLIIADQQEEQGESAIVRGYHVMLGRKGEPMRELIPGGNHHHNIHQAARISQVTVKQGGQPKPPYNNASQVVITGDRGTKLTVHVVNGKVEVTTDHDLAPANASGFGECYQETDVTIATVLVDAYPPIQANGTPIRVVITLA